MRSTQVIFSFSEKYFSFEKYTSSIRIYQKCLIYQKLVLTSDSIRKLNNVIMKFFNTKYLLYYLSI